VIREEWKPGYHENLWCGACVAEMYKTAYNNYFIYLAKEERNRVTVIKEEKVELPTEQEAYIKPEAAIQSRNAGRKNKKNP
jgi:hypothetical protein